MPRAKPALTMLPALSTGPDLVIVDTENDEVAAIVEVKYLTGEDATDRVKSAIAQLVRYARGHGPIGEIGPLLERSLVVVSQGIDGLTPQTPLPRATPLVTDLGGIKQRSLCQWARRLSTAALEFL